MGADDQVGEVELPVALKTARGAAFLVIACTSAGAFAGWNAYSSRSGEGALQATYIARAAATVPLTSNREAKADKLPVRTRVASLEPMVKTDLADAGVARIAAVPATVPLPPTKPKIPAAQPPQAANGGLDESQISHIKTRLRLTPSQMQYWPAVEAALRDVIRQHAREARRSGSHVTAANIDTNSPEVQRL